MLVPVSPSTMRSTVSSAARALELIWPGPVVALVPVVPIPVPVPDPAPPGLVVEGADAGAGKVKGAGARVLVPLPLLLPGVDGVVVVTGVLDPGESTGMVEGGGEGWEGTGAAFGCHDWLVGLEA